MVPPFRHRHNIAERSIWKQSKYTFISETIKEYNIQRDDTHVDSDFNDTPFNIFLDNPQNFDESKLNSYNDAINDKKDIINVVSSPQFSLNTHFKLNRIHNKNTDIISKLHPKSQKNMSDFKIDIISCSHNLMVSSLHFNSHNDTIKLSTTTLQVQIQNFW